MVRLNDGLNDIFVTITENGGGDYYILRVVDNMDINVESLCILGNNISPDPTRYDKFELNVATASAITEGLFVAINENGFAWNSSDGFSWATHSAATGNEIWLTYLSERKRLLAVSYAFNQSEWTDNPYESWTPTYTPFNLTTRVSYSPKLDRVIGFKYDENYILYSDDGAVTWATASYNTPIEPFLPASCWSTELDRWMLVGGNFVAFSPDGINWDEASTDLPNGADEYLGWIKELNLYLLLRGEEAISDSQISSDGIHWFPVDVNSGGSYCSFTDFAYGGIVDEQLIVAVGYHPDIVATDTISTSPNGIDWTRRESPIDGNWVAVDWSPVLNMFVATPRDATPFIGSYDGINWFVCSDMTIGAFNDMLWVETSGYNNEILILKEKGQYNYEIWGMTGSAPFGEQPIIYEGGTILEKGRIILQ
jgi:hypothetical protein